MEPWHFAVPIFVSVVYLSGGTQDQNSSSTNSTAANATDKGNKTKIRPYEKFRAIEMIRAQVLKKTTLNTVCKPKSPAEGDEIVITDMTLGSRAGPENGNFEFTKLKQNHTIGSKEEIIETATVSTVNECVGKCAANEKCLSYAYEDRTKGCKLANTCTPKLAESTDSMVFSMSYWYKM